MGTSSSSRRLATHGHGHGHGMAWQSRDRYRHLHDMATQQRKRACALHGDAAIDAAWACGMCMVCEHGTYAFDVSTGTCIAAAIACSCACARPRLRARAPVARRAVPTRTVRTHQWPVAHCQVLCDIAQHQRQRDERQQVKDKRRNRAPPKKE
eukprot:298633-Chlamydomonas_euryale.AAC.2